MLIEKLKFIMSFVCFGLVGILAEFIPLSSFSLVFYRALLGCVFMLFIVCFLKKQFRVDLILKNIKTILIAGFFMGINWAFMLMSMKTASVSIGTVCYNTAPIFMILSAYIILKDKITKKSIICIILGLIGVVFVSDIINAGFQKNVMIGVFYGIIGGLFYGLVVIINKKLCELNPYEKISIEFLIATIFMIPFIIFDFNSSFLFGPTDNFWLAFIFLLIIGLFITGYMYIVYFDCVNRLPAKTVAICTYIDPVVTLLLSNIVLHEKLNGFQIFGAILILLATIINEFCGKDNS